MSTLIAIPTNHGSWLEQYSGVWKQHIETLTTQFGGDLERVITPWEGPTDVPILYVKKASLIKFLSTLKKELGYIYLADFTATDEGAETNPRFELVYNLYGLGKSARIRVKCRLAENEEAPTAISVWPGADWAEREIFDMYGIRFTGHPNLRRILMDYRWVGYPLRKDYPLDGFQLFPDAEPPDASRLGGERGDTAVADPDDLWDDSRTIINLGPTHPAMHGSFRMVAKINGETIEKSYCEFGYTHRAKEKLGEHRTYHQFIVFTDRLNYCSALMNNVSYAMSVERLMGIEVPPRCTWIRMIASELSRITDHLICVGIGAVDVGAFSYFLYGFHQREEAYTLIEKLCGARLTTSYTRIGGLMYDAPPGWEKEVKEWVKRTRSVTDEMDRLLTTNKIFCQRTQGIGKFNKEQATEYSFSGPSARASGVDWDLRRDQPYMFYDQLDFDIPIGTQGDVYDRYLVRVEEMRQSLRIIEQCIDRLEAGPIWSDDKRVHIPAKQDVYTSMESMIHHFKFFMEGFNVPAGEAYTPFEGANGEMGFYIISKGERHAHRMRIRGPSFWHYQALSPMSEGSKIADMVATLGSINIIAGELDR